MNAFEPHIAYCPRCVYPSGAHALAVVVYLGGWLRVERCDSCHWIRFISA